MYKIHKNEVLVKDNLSEQEVRDFAQSLNDQYINWRNHMQQDPLIKVGDALNSNGYILTLNGETIITK
jgi:hypothetical protein